MKNMSTRQERIIFVIICGLPLAPIQSIQGASFNCSKASNIVESLICKDSILSKKDEQMARLYKKAMSELPRSMQKGLRGDQRNWISERDNCEDRECLEYQYSRRIYELKHYFDEGE